MISPRAQPPSSRRTARFLPDDERPRGANNLPADVLLHIVAIVRAKSKRFSIANVACVCREWANVCRAMPAPRPYTVRTFPSPVYSLRGSTALLHDRAVDVNTGAELAAFTPTKKASLSLDGETLLLRDSFGFTWHRLRDQTNGPPVYMGYSSFRNFFTGIPKPLYSILIDSHDDAVKPSVPGVAYTTYEPCSNFFINANAPKSESVYMVDDPIVGIDPGKQVLWTCDGEYVAAHSFTLVRRYDLDFECNYKESREFKRERMHGAMYDLEVDTTTRSIRVLRWSDRAVVDIVRPTSPTSPSTWTCTLDGENRLHFMDGPHNGRVFTLRLSV